MTTRLRRIRREGIIRLFGGSLDMTNEIIPITVYWRPGCPFCDRLRHGLQVAGVSTEEFNIWDDPSAAAAVRLVANGNETVPTVTVGVTVMVNPTVKAVLSEIQSQSPDMIPTVSGPSVDVEESGRTTLEVVQWLAIIALLALSFLAEGLGYGALSWGIDGLNVALYFVLKGFRRRSFDRKWMREH